MESLRVLDTEILIDLYRYFSNKLKKVIKSDSENSNFYTVENITNYFNSIWAELSERGFTKKELQNRLNADVTTEISDRCKLGLEHLHHENNYNSVEADSKNQNQLAINLQRRSLSFNDVQIPLRGKNGLTLHYFYILYVIALMANPVTPEELYAKARELGLKVPEQESQVNEIHYAVRKVLRHAAKENPGKISEQEIKDLFFNLGDGRTQLNIPPEKILLIDQGGEVVKLVE